MAIVRLGPIVSAISGALGSVVFVAGGRSTVARLRPLTIDKSTSFSLRQDGRMANLRRYWSTMTDLQKERWNTDAHDIPQTNALGVASPMSGFNYFIMTNKKAFPDIFTTFPFPAALEQKDFVVNPAASFSASGAYTVEADNPWTPGILRIRAYGWPFWRTTKSKEVARLVYLASWSATTDPITFNVRTAWLEHFGPLQEGQRYAIGIKSQFSHSPFAPTTVLRQTVAA